MCIAVVGERGQGAISTQSPSPLWLRARAPAQPHPVHGSGPASLWDQPTFTEYDDVLNLPLPLKTVPASLGRADH